jgi:hypothetical protein
MSVEDSVAKWPEPGVQSYRDSHIQSARARMSSSDWARNNCFRKFAAYLRIFAGVFHGRSAFFKSCWKWASLGFIYIVSALLEYTTCKVIGWSMLLYNVMYSVYYLMYKGNNRYNSRWFFSLYLRFQNELKEPWIVTIKLVEVVKFFFCMKRLAHW